MTSQFNPHIFFVFLYSPLFLLFLTETTWFSKNQEKHSRQTKTEYAEDEHHWS